MRLKTQDKEENEELTFKNEIRVLRGRQKFLNGLGSKLFPIVKQKIVNGRPRMLNASLLGLACVACIAKVSDHSHVKILIPKRMLP